VAWENQFIQLKGVSVEDEVGRVTVRERDLLGAARDVHAQRVLVGVLLVLALPVQALLV